MWSRRVQVFEPGHDIVIAAETPRSLDLLRIEVQIYAQVQAKLELRRCRHVCELIHLELNWWAHQSDQAVSIKHNVMRQLHTGNDQFRAVWYRIVKCRKSQSRSSISEDDYAMQTNSRTQEVLLVFLLVCCAALAQPPLRRQRQMSLNAAGRSSRKINTLCRITPYSTREVHGIKRTKSFYSTWPVMQSCNEKLLCKVVIKSCHEKLPWKVDWESRLNSRPSKEWWNTCFSHAKGGRSPRAITLSAKRRQIMAAR